MSRNRRVYQLNLDESLDERGGAGQTHDGITVRCPNCTEDNLLAFIIDHGRCIQCDMAMNAYIGYGDDSDV